MRVNKKLFLENRMDDGSRILINQGGTSSGKTYCIMQVLFDLACSQPNQIITWGRTSRTSKREHCAMQG